MVSCLRIGNFPQLNLGCISLSQKCIIITEFSLEQTEFVPCCLSWFLLEITKTQWLWQCSKIKTRLKFLTYLPSSKLGLLSEQLQCVLLIPDWQLDVLLWFIQRVCSLSVVWLGANITLIQDSPGDLGLEGCFVSAVFSPSGWVRALISSSAGRNISTRVRDSSSLCHLRGFGCNFRRWEEGQAYL